MKKILFICVLTASYSSYSTILTCSDRIEEMKKNKEKEGLGKLGELSCKDSKAGKVARYKEGSEWKCKILEDFPCVHDPKLKMVQCDREWECAKSK